MQHKLNAFGGCYNVIYSMKIFQTDAYMLGKKPGSREKNAMLINTQHRGYILF